ncbi:hypothetical protein RJ640_022039 [Escallonia rubra]|uniref:t-SNARE coiled-coil homology domain-containing protein n=1 Tax=Escallonia rubra TaxID=112253 RepID=A0AA88QNF6_9ASTE|nr:hypothetical protein RJ640_022039 [Escallonia rubra]
MSSIISTLLYMVAEYQYTFGSYVILSFWFIFVYREHWSSRAALFDSFDGIEEGGLRAASSYSRDIDEVDNDKAIDSLQDRVIFLKRLTGDIHEEVNSHNRMLDQMGNKMDASRGIMSGTMDRFKMVFEKKSSRRMCALVSCFVVSFFIIYYLMRYQPAACHGYIILVSGLCRLTLSLSAKAEPRALSCNGGDLLLIV